VEILIFSQDSNRPAIGTRDLNSCTAVAIVSPYAAILAHINPWPYPSTDPGARIQNVQDRMNEMMNLYRRYLTCFPLHQTYSIVVGGTYNNNFVLYDQVNWIRDMLRRDNLEPMMEEYEVHQHGHSGPAQGAVFIDARSGSPVVFVEDKIVTC